jgi:PAS domain-containing protein
VIFLTAHADQDTLKRAKASEPCGYLVKPFRQINLSTSIEMAIHKHSIETQLKQRLGWLTNVLVSSPDPTIVTDTEGVIQFMNVEAALVADCSPSEWRGRRFCDIVALYDPISGDIADDFVGYALAKKTSFAFPSGLCFRDPNERQIMIEGEVAAGLMGQYADVGAVITFRDIDRPRGGS